MESTNSSKNGTNGTRHRYAFGEFEVDGLNRTCTRDGKPVPVSGKVYDVLLAFVESPGRLLTKDELIERVWRDEFVEEGNLARNVSTLRKALGDTDRKHKYIVTVPGHGYRFAAEVALTDTTVRKELVLAVAAPAGNEAPAMGREFLPRSRKLLLAVAAVLIVLSTVAWFVRGRLFPAAPAITSIAVLPLRGIDPNDNYLGVGIADAVIRRLSTSRGMTVRPTSAVLHYSGQDTDSLTAAKELDTDAILEGNVQRFGDRLRVSVNLLRTADSSSIWTDNFDLASEDIFRVQDEVAQRVADSLKIKIGGARDGMTKYPANTEAYELYVRGVFSFDERGIYAPDARQAMETIDFFKRSIELDPNYAPAHGRLAITYAWVEMLVKPDEPEWAALAKTEIDRAEQLDPDIAESHLARALLLWSKWGGYQMDAAVNEMRTVKRLDPNFASSELPDLYGHMGLIDQANSELDHARKIDPTSQSLRTATEVMPYLRIDPDGWKATSDRPIDERFYGVWYYLRKGSYGDGERLIGERLARNPEDYTVIISKGILAALKGKFSEADAELAKVMALVPHSSETYHHQTYNAACIYALEGKSSESVKWLRETARIGFPNYPMFARDPYLDRIRQTPEFIQFLAEQKAQWDRFQQEFPDA